MRLCVIEPIISVNEFELQFSELNFALLVLSTVLLAAAGYFINDYFDTGADSINKPNSNYVGKIISKKTTMTVHLILNAIAIVIGFYISIKIGIYKIGFLYVIIAGLLWFYSSSYKRLFLVGNIIIALLSALVPFIVAIYEIPLLNTTYAETLLKYGINFNVVIFWVLGFTFFAFITSLIREMLKDIEDVKGDKIYKNNTVPIIIGTFYTKIIIIGLIALTIASLIFTYFKFLNDNISLIYIIIALILPFVFLIFKIIAAKDSKHFHFASTVTKIIMVLGILFSIIAYYNFSLL